MHILWTLIIGLIVGAIAKLLMPGRDPGGFIVTALIGIAGSFVASFLGRTLGLYRAGTAPGIIASILGAMLLLFLYRVIQRRRA
ncbi:MAG TPA: GlsB/YeaQ/YmgE family stress response membrane protein [Polyangia bacterium]